MYTRQALLDLHDRAHRSLRLLIEHCGGLGEGALKRELPGFGYPTVHLQLDHVIGAERYWTGVLQGKLFVDDTSELYPTAASLEDFRVEVFGETAAYLHKTSEAELNAEREVLTWQGKKRLVVPARVIVRPCMHIYHHQGQVLAMCRLLGDPHPGGLDFPFD